jgi:hypothetical protein
MDHLCVGICVWNLQALAKVKANNVRYRCVLEIPEDQ